MSGNPLQVDVFELAKRGETRAGELALAVLPRLAQSQASAAAAAEPLQPVMFVLEGFMDERRRPSARLALDGEIDLVCDRCAKPLRWRLQSQARYFFVRSEDELARLPVDEAEEEPLLGATRFDLRGLVEDEAILALPMSPRHVDCELEVPLPAAQSKDEPAPERPSPFAQLEKLKSRRH
jgi:uncharacterized protein